MPTGTPTPVAEPRSRSAYALLVVVVLLSFTETLAHFIEIARVAPRSDYDAAIAFVRSEWRERDAITSVPEWIDPNVRAAAGDLVDDRMAGRSDLASYARLWSISIRGARAVDAPHEAPTLRRAFGHVSVERWELPAPSVTYDFTDHVGSAHAFLRNGESTETECRSIASIGATPGGLSAGPQTTANHFECGGFSEPWLWVGATVNEDLELRPRRSIYQHPVEGGTIALAFDDVPLGESIVLYSGLWWEFERTRDGSPITMVIRLGLGDGAWEEIGRAVHHDGDGWSRMEASIPEARRGTRGNVRFEVSAEGAYHRSYSWSATMRRAQLAVASAPSDGGPR
jgi:hypothetical protein